MHLLGNGPVSLEIGDQLWIIAGADIPLLLRPLSNGKYQLVGQAYVHGIMHGEALQGQNVPQHIVFE